MTDDQKQPRKKGRKKKWILRIVIAIGLYFIIAHLPVPPPKLIVSKETTYITDPTFNPDGTVNYVEWLNRHYSEGVTKENNAAALYLAAFGPDCLKDEKAAEKFGPNADPYWIRSKVLTLLDLPLPSVPSEGLGDWEKYAAAHSPASTQPTIPIPELTDFCEKPWTRQEHPLVADFLEANAEPLALITQACRLPRLYVPLVCPKEPPEILAVVMPPSGRHKAAARVLASRVMHRLGEGRTADAWEDVLTLHRMARQVMHQPFLIGRLSGLAIESLATHSGSAVATYGNLSSEQARSMRADLINLPPLEGVDEALNFGERLMILDCMMMLSRGSPVGPDNAQVLHNAIDLNQLLRRANSAYDRCAIAGYFSEVQDNDQGKLAAVKMAILANGGWPCRKAFTNGMADLLIRLLMPTLGRSRTIHKTALQKRDLEELAFSLAIYKTENGAYPKTLAELTPKYLAEIPKDRFSDKDLIYKPEGDGYILYSVGEEGIDDGGKDANAKGDDIVVRCGLPEPATQPASGPGGEAAGRASGS